MSEQITQITWPSTGPKFNLWYTNLPLFSRLLEVTEDIGWWTSDPKCKYLNIRIDTRNTAFKVFASNYEAMVHVEPDYVLNIILTYMLRYDKSKIAAVKACTQLPELIELISRMVTQYSADLRAVRRKPGEPETIPTVPNGKPVYVEIEPNIIGEIASVDSTTVVVANTINGQWFRRYHVDHFSKITKFRRDAEGNKIWNAIGVPMI